MRARASILYVVCITQCFSATLQQPQAPSAPAAVAGNASPAATSAPQAALPPSSAPLHHTVVSGKPEYTVNASLPLKGETGILGNHIFDGMSLFFNKIKQELTQTPLLLGLNALDDRGEVPLLRTNITSQQRSSPLFLSLLGTHSLVGLSEQIKKREILALFPLDGALRNRNKDVKNIIYFRPHFEEEIDALVKYSSEHLNRKKIGMFYEASDWGESALECAKKVVKKYGLELHVIASYPQQSLVVGPAIEEISKKAPNAIICFAGARPAYNFIRGIINKGLHKTVILGPSNLFSIQTTLSRSRGVGIVTSMVVPDPEKSTIQIAQEYRADLKRYFSNKQPNPFSFESYINAALLYEALKGITQPITVDKIISIFEGIKSMNFKGLELNFEPETRSLYHSVTINDATNVSALPKEKAPESSSADKSPEKKS